MRTKITFIFTLLLFVGLAVNSQENKENRANRIKSLKVSYITEQLNLTPEEAEKFWPIYNERQDKIHKLHNVENRKLRKELQDKTNLENMSDADAEEMLNKLLKLDKDILAEKSAMFSDLNQILPPKKLLKLHKAENDFNRKILEQYRKRREQKPKQ